MREYDIKITQPDSGKRLDLFLADFFKKEHVALSRTAIQKLILNGKVSLKGSLITSPHYKVRLTEGLRIEMEDKASSKASPEEIPFDIIYEDEDLAVINKPAGLVVHPAPGNYEHTLVNALLFSFGRLSDINPGRPGIVHRLDKGTSGLLVIARSNLAHLDLARQFAEHSIQRKYVALVKGVMEFDEDIIELPIGRHPRKRKNMSVVFNDKSKYAKTHYRTLKRLRGFSMVELFPFTGRTHQLRVHLAFLGHPILGDDKYGRDNTFIRLALHAQSIGFMHPRRKEFMHFDSELPIEFKEYLKEG
ncbi:MAG: RluA family pseudouridine synthase [Candidatus Omnitrophota bacterium]